MTTLEDLTEAYFKATTLIRNEKDRFGNDWQNDYDTVDQIDLNRERVIIQFKAIDILNYGEIFLHVGLRDREEFIDCEHGGAGDNYFLNLQFSVQEKTIQGLKIVNFLWDEEFCPSLN